MVTEQLFLLFGCREAINVNLNKLDDVVLFI